MSIRKRTWKTKDGPKTAWVVDYKSHQQAAADTVATLAAGYRQQLGYYAAGITRLWPERRVRCFLLFTHCRLLHEIDITEPTAIGTAHPLPSLGR